MTVANVVSQELRFQINNAINNPMNVPVPINHGMNKSQKLFE